MGSCRESKLSASGVDVKPKDIGIISDREGAEKMAHLLKEFVIKEI